MQLHTLLSEKKRYKSRIGRGGKRGTTSGRGQKGQKSRSGRRIRPAERDLIIRLPKKRGFHNKPKSEPAFIIKLSDLGKFEGVIDRDTLKKKGLIPRCYNGPIKILSSGIAAKGINLKGLSVSKQVRKKILEAGGTLG